MAIGLSGSVEGDLQLSRMLLTGSIQVNNLQRPLGQARQQLLSTTQLNFGALGGLMGGWKPRAQIRSWPLLQKTGKMRGNFQSSLSPNRMEIWNPTFYFKFHQSNRSRRRLPRRVMLKIIAQDKRRIQKFFQAHVQNALKGRSS